MEGELGVFMEAHGVRQHLWEPRLRGKIVQSSETVAYGRQQPGKPSKVLVLEARMTSAGYSPVWWDIGGGATVVSLG